MFKFAVLAAFAVVAHAQLFPVFPNSPNFPQRPQQPIQILPEHRPIQRPQQPIAEVWRAGRRDSRCDIEYGPNDIPLFLTTNSCTQFEKCNGGYACEFYYLKYLKGCNETIIIFILFLVPFTCPENLHFNAALKVCDFPAQAGCNFNNINNRPWRRFGEGEEE